MVLWCGRMKWVLNVRNLPYLLLALIIVALYFLFATRGTFKVPHDLDYFNPLAQSFIEGRLDLINPIVTHDLSHYNGRWYPYWGPLPALFLIPVQLIIHRFIPAIYVSLLTTLIAVPIWLFILQKVNSWYFQNKMSLKLILFWVACMFLGTSLFYVSTRSGVWFVSQAVAFLPQLIAFYFLLKPKMSRQDYFAASFFISIELLCRYSLVLTGVLLVARLVDDFIFNKEWGASFRAKVISAAIPFVCFFSMFASYNAARFSGPLDTGYLYHNLSHLNKEKLLPHGILSILYFPRNLWLTLVEWPQITWKGKWPLINFNQEASSLFFAMPLFIASLLSFSKDHMSLGSLKGRLPIYLWLTTLALFFPSLLLFSPGLVQFGMRYSLDFAVPLLILALFGLNGKGNVLVFIAGILAIIFSTFSLFAFG